MASQRRDETTAGSFEAPKKHHIAWRALGAYERFEIVSAVVGLILAMRQFLLIDHELVGFCVIWTVPAVLATFATLHPRTPSGLRTTATIYVALVCVGSWLAPFHSILPGLGGEHPGGTEFAAEWNRLGIAARRLIAWNMALAGAAMFLGIGYPYWAQLRRQRRGIRPRMSPAICKFALIVVWGIPTLMLPLLFVMAL